MLGNLIGGFIIILVGVQLLPVIADAINGSLYVGGNTSRLSNVTGASATILGLTTIFYALGIMAAGVALAITGLRDANVL